LCETNGQIVFLDLRRDRYLAISFAERASLLGRVRGWREAEVPAHGAYDSASEEALKTMLKHGLLTVDSRRGKAAASPSVEPVHGVLVTDDYDLHIPSVTGYAARFLIACTRAQLALRLRSLERVVNSVQRRKKRAWNIAPLSLDRERELVATFLRLRPLAYTARDACLFDSLALLTFLAMHGSFPTWVIGVATTPFAAHSWIQRCGFVFNGDAEYVRQFKPILCV